MNRPTNEAWRADSVFQIAMGFRQLARELARELEAPEAPEADDAPEFDTSDLESDDETPDTFAAVLEARR